MFHSRHVAASTRRRVTTALVGFVTISVALSFFVIWLQGLPGPLRGAYSARASLCNIYEGLREYNKVNGRLPPAVAKDVKSGKSSSWRIAVYQSTLRHFPSLIAKPNGNVSREYDRSMAWNDPANLRLQERGAWLFSYTQGDPYPPSGSRGKHGRCTTYYKAITGPSTAFDSANPPSLKQLPKNLILVVRVEDSDTHWMEPGDLNIEELASSEKTKRLLLGKSGYVVLFADGAGWVLSRKLPISDLCKFFTIEGARQYDREKLLGPYRGWPR